MSKKSSGRRAIIFVAGEGIWLTLAPGGGEGEGEESLDDVGDNGRGGVSRRSGAGDGGEEGLDIGGKEGASWDIFSNPEMGRELGSDQTSLTLPR